jgi:hypothetical protein
MKTVIPYVTMGSGQRTTYASPAWTPAVNAKMEPPAQPVNQGFSIMEYALVNAQEAFI